MKRRMFLGKIHRAVVTDANLDYEPLAREILEEAKAVDAAEDEAFGEARGDELHARAGDEPGPARLAARSQASP